MSRKFDTYVCSIAGRSVHTAQQDYQRKATRTWTVQFTLGVGLLSTYFDA